METTCLREWGYSHLIVKKFFIFMSLSLPLNQAKTKHQPLRCSEKWCVSTHSIKTARTGSCVPQQYDLPPPPAPPLPPHCQQLTPGEKAPDTDRLIISPLTEDLQASRMIPTIVGSDSKTLSNRHLRDIYTRHNCLSFAVPH